MFNQASKLLWTCWHLAQLSCIIIRPSPAAIRTASLPTPSRHMPATAPSSTQAPAAAFPALLRAAWTLLLVGLTGCASLVPPAADVPGQPRPQLHTLYIDEQGQLLDPQTRARIAPAATAPSTALQAEEGAYVQAIIDHFQALRKDRPDLELTLHLHGGLNTFSSATSRSQRFAADMLAEGQYPVFIGWNSGPFTNYFDHLFRIRKGERRPVLAPLTAPLVLAEDLARSVVRIPTALYKEVRDPLAVSLLVTTEEEEDYNERRVKLEAAGLRVWSEPPFRGVGSSYWSAPNPLKLITAPLVDGLGSGAWDSMLRRTDLVLSKTSAFEDAAPPEGDAYADTAATTFLKRWTQDLSHRDVKVNLIGHSMGAIVVNNILARHPQLRVDNLVYMGGAARIKDVEAIVVPWLASPAHAGARFYNLSLDPYNEMAERTAGDFLPRGSLLNWIDGIFGEVNSFKDRTVGGWWNITRTAADVFRLQPIGPIGPTGSGRVVLKRFAIGEGQGPQRHGEFGDHCFWQRRFWDSAAPAARHPTCLLQKRQN
jgi:pimeloyl-ACP methyl ester carboxylesterase